MKTNIQKVRDGDFIHGWGEVQVRVGDNTFIFNMSRFPVTLFSGKDRYFGSFNAEETAEVLSIIKGHAPLAALLDIRYEHSIKNFPSPLPAWKTPREMNSIKNQILHTKKCIDSAPGWSFDTDTIIGNAGKPNTWPLRLERIYGWHVSTSASTWNGIALHNAIHSKGLKVIQRESVAHSGSNKFKIDPRTHCDYSMTVVAVDDTVVVVDDSGYIVTLGYEQAISLGNFMEHVGFKNKGTHEIIRDRLIYYGLDVGERPNSRNGLFSLKEIQSIHAFCNKIGSSYEVGQDLISTFGGIGWLNLIV